MFTKVKTADEIEAMRESGRMLATVLQKVASEVAVGLSTKDLAVISQEELKPLGGKPAFLGYYGFPDVLCVSVNDEVVHGIPSPKKIIQAGDIVSLDFGVNYRGMITDSALSVVVSGNPKNKKHKSSIELVQTTETALAAGAEAIKGKTQVGVIAAAIQRVLEEGKYGVVRDLVGHGVGHELHEDPNIPNFGSAQSGPDLLPGMTIAIEPMATLGSHRVYVDADGWTVRTSDGSLSAHFEHTVLITDTGYEILTKL